MSWKSVGAILLGGMVWGCATSPPPLEVLPPPSDDPNLLACRAALLEAAHDLDSGRSGEARATLDRLMERLVFSPPAPAEAAQSLLGAAVAMRWPLDLPDSMAEEDPVPVRDPAPPWWDAGALAHPEVERWRTHFTDLDPHGVEVWLHRMAPHRLAIQRTLWEQDLPEDLWVVTLLESGGRAAARSDQGAVGPWQLVPRTARYLGILITPDRDQRRDWDLATRAAATYLTELHSEFGDGLLALAAFNCGPGRVRRQIARDETRDFWRLKLPRETRNYVPRILGLASYLETQSLPSPDTTATRLVPLAHPVSLESLAEAARVPPDSLWAMNPAWLHDVTPGDGYPARARVPAASAASIVDGFARGEFVEAVPASRRRVHEVVAGDTLWTISRTYGVRLRDVLALNGLSGREVIKPGQSVMLPR